MANPRILIVDTDFAYLQQLKSVLTRLDFMVVGEACDGPSALKLVRTRDPDLLITQDKLPGISGIEIARIMYEDKLGPVIITTDYLEQELLVKAKEFRVSQILVKPLEDYHLLPAVELALGNYQEIIKLEKQIKDLKNNLESRKLVEKAKGILMQTMHLNEAEAFRRIQKQSMNKRMSMRAVAEAVIMAHSLQDTK